MISMHFPICGPGILYMTRRGIPALEEVKFSLTSNRGCFGGCNFCALTFHQGRTLQVRSHESLLQEAEEMTKDPAKGYIHDGRPHCGLGIPPVRNSWASARNRQCLFGSLKSGSGSYRLCAAAAENSAGAGSEKVFIGPASALTMCWPIRIPLSAGTGGASYQRTAPCGTGARIGSGADYDGKSRPIAFMRDF